MAISVIPAAPGSPECPSAIHLPPPGVPTTTAIFTTAAPSPQPLGMHPATRFGATSPRQVTNVVAARFDWSHGLHIDCAAPNVRSAESIEGVFHALYSVWPRYQGKLDMRGLRSLVVPIHCSNGHVVTLSHLLRYYPRTQPAKTVGKRRPVTRLTPTEADLPRGKPLSFHSFDGIYWLFCKVMGVDRIETTQRAKDPPHVLRVNVVIKNPPDAADIRRILKAAWALHKESKYPIFSFTTAHDYWVETYDQKRIRLWNLMQRYWDEVRPQLIAKGLIDPKISSRIRSEEVLDIMHYQLFHQVRLHSHSARSRIVAYPLPLREQQQRFPNPLTLLGALQLATLIMETEQGKNFRSFPYAPKNYLVIWYDPRTGQCTMYETFMKRLNGLIAAAKQRREPTVEAIAMDDDFIADPHAAAQRFPRINTRRSLVTQLRQTSPLPTQRVVIHRRRQGAHSA